MIKENSKPDSTLAAVTVMYEQEGYDLEHNDWYGVKYMPDGSVANEGKAEGRVPGCIQCHGGTGRRRLHHDRVTGRPVSSPGLHGGASNESVVRTDSWVEGPRVPPFNEASRT